MPAGGRIYRERAPREFHLHEGVDRNLELGRSATDAKLGQFLGWDHSAESAPWPSGEWLLVFAGRIGRVAKCIGNQLRALIRLDVSFCGVGFPGEPQRVNDSRVSCLS
mgnify:CR=1 FL=1